MKESEQPFEVELGVSSETNKLISSPGNLLQRTSSTSLDQEKSKAHPPSLDQEGAGGYQARDIDSDRAQLLSPSDRGIPAGTLHAIGDLSLEGRVEEESDIGQGRRWYTTVMLSLTTTFLFADQNLMAPNLTAIAESFGFSEEERDSKLGGEIAVAFFLVGAPVAIAVGYLTDTCDRRTLFLLVVFLGEVPCLLTYWVEKYWQLFVLRMLTGISIGGAIPLVFSILGDLFPVGHRSEMAVVPGMAMGIGQLVGQAMAGFVGPAYGWRVPFVIVAIPTMALAVIMWLTTREPPRGQCEAALSGCFKHDPDGFAYSEKLSLAKFWRMWQIRSNQVVFLQAIPGCIPWGVLITYFNDYMAQEKGLGVVGATNVLLAFGVGCAAGNVAGGMLGQRFYNYSKDMFAFFLAFATFVAILPLVAVVNLEFRTRALPAVYVLASAGGALASVAGCNIRAVLLNVNAPETRGTVFAFYNLADDLGKGLGPGVVALMIAGWGRQAAFNVAMWTWAPCALTMALFTLTLDADEQSMQKQLAEVSDRAGEMTSCSLDDIILGRLSPPSDQQKEVSVAMASRVVASPSASFVTKVE